MDFAETEDQQMIREMVREFAETVAGPTFLNSLKKQVVQVFKLNLQADISKHMMILPKKLN